MRQTFTNRRQMLKDTFFSPPLGRSFGVALASFSVSEDVLWN